ncbi:TIP41-like protein [Argiope bruennichi]|uniref:TIP41-like protein n=1 Tax=Argiope bruennichi TaxID=94029 RepID=A0A8T0DYE8_ARGBR|nr:TIP41-like protein [Argiope bruennichi]XP_055946409.1 TIP41-like protein [Argiope bruennichi]XP_055946418.1 TIP41-like protein [Argiope bruennichi]XP_055946427.1 TIP41-like protein [Argiope bruennichi]XP_055946435.1 TIP41-like protein [Argiope bruennichi]XP_055946445.1 TIP41-like protein [Argiope bruennichi]KAF8763522.1 TIP41-like protein like [Argiope bruennichi]
MSDKVAVDKATFNFGQWTVQANKSHILQSRCTQPLQCNVQNEGTPVDKSVLCDFCLYEKELELPQLPEMLFASNSLKLEHDNGFGIEFNALDALKLVDSKNDVMKVAVAEAWQESRVEDCKIKDVVKPFDWTYTTRYKGTLFGGTEIFKVTPTEERINVEKLKVKSKILFYQDIILFEDELADNGTAQLSVKMRIMPDSFLILLRFFLRVDNVLVRIIDTRIFHEIGKNYLLREHTAKENKIKDLQVSIALLNTPADLWDHLSTVSYENEKIEF